MGAVVDARASADRWLTQSIACHQVCSIEPACTPSLKCKDVVYHESVITNDPPRPPPWRTQVGEPASWKSRHEHAYHIEILEGWKGGTQRLRQL
jgi:hypothetical protein